VRAPGEQLHVYVRSRRHRFRSSHAAWSFQGDLSSFSGHNLGSHAIGAALERAKLSPEQIDEVLMGCVLPAGQGQAPARQAARGAKLPDAAGATTINKVCGSGMKATMLAHDLISAGSANIVVSGGMESMTNAPYLLQKARGGYRVGHDRIIDHMMMDGLEDAYERPAVRWVISVKPPRKPISSAARIRTNTLSKH
jgi:acetyl-CoA C-acetyltransferase